jgi:tRNA(Ile)-lysidine synthase
MKPLGMAGSKKLSDVFTDLKVPRAERNARIVVECGGQVAALAGWRVSRDFAVAGPRAESIRIRFSPYAAGAQLVVGGLAGAVSA